MQYIPIKREDLQFSSLTVFVTVMYKCKEVFYNFISHFNLIKDIQFISFCIISEKEKTKITFC